MKQPDPGIPTILILTNTVLTRTPGVLIMIIPVIEIRAKIIQIMTITSTALQTMMILTKILMMGVIIQIDARFVTTAWIAGIIHVPIVVMMNADAVSVAASTAVFFAKPAAAA